MATSRPLRALVMISTFIAQSVGAIVLPNTGLAITAVGTPKAKNVTAAAAVAMIQRLMDQVSKVARKHDSPMRSPYTPGDLIPSLSCGRS